MLADDDTLESVVARADAALYRAKANRDVRSPPLALKVGAADNAWPNCLS